MDMGVIDGYAVTHTGDTLPIGQHLRALITVTAGSRKWLFSYCGDIEYRYEFKDIL